METKGELNLEKVGVTISVTPTFRLQSNILNIYKKSEPTPYRD